MDRLSYLCLCVSVCVCNCSCHRCLSVCLLCVCDCRLCLVVVSPCISLVEHKQTTAKLRINNHTPVHHCRGTDTRWSSSCSKNKDEKNCYDVRQIRPRLYGETSCPGYQRHPPPRTNFTARFMEESCPGWLGSKVGLSGDWEDLTKKQKQKQNKRKQNTLYKVEHGRSKEGCPIIDVGTLKFNDCLVVNRSDWLWREIRLAHAQCAPKVRRKARSTTHPHPTPSRQTGRAKFSHSSF